jgi:hypothetical protein
VKPADALRLPRARLTDDQRKATAKAIELLEGLYEQSMSRAGVIIDMRCDDFTVLLELQRHCEAEGWLTQVAPDWQPPHVQGGRPALRGFKMNLTPPRSAYDAVDAETQS